MLDKTKCLEKSRHSVRQLPVLHFPVRRNPVRYFRYFPVLQFHSAGPPITGTSVMIE